MGYMYPFPRDTAVSQPFAGGKGSPYNPPMGHTGEDAAVPVGTPVRAAGDGVIELSSWVGENYLANEWWLTQYGGDMIVLNCGDNEPTFIYAHLLDSIAEVGDRVRKGQVIATSGNSGTATTGPHCHIEALPPRWDTNNGFYGRVNPRLYLTEFYGDIGYDSTTTPQSTTEPKADDDMTFILAQRPGEQAIWLGNYMERRYIGNEQTLKDVRYHASKGWITLIAGGEIQPVDNLDTIGQAI